ncbi:MAG: AbfB domain-containing protein [Halopseudomonas aestusnigri]
MIRYTNWLNRMLRNSLLRILALHITTLKKWGRSLFAFILASVLLTSPAIAIEEGDIILIESVSIPNHFVRHRNYQGFITPIVSATDRKDSSFVLTRSLGYPSERNTISFESINFPDHYLTHRNDDIRLERNDGSSQFQIAASFRRIPGFRGGSTSSIEAMSRPRYYIRQQNSALILEPLRNTSLYRGDASFTLHQANEQGFNPQQQDYFRIQAVHSNACLGVAGASRGRADIVQAPAQNCASSLNMLFTLDRVNGGNWIRTKHTDGCLGVAGGKRDRSPIVHVPRCDDVDTFKYNLQAVGIHNGQQTYNIKVRHTGGCIAIAGASLDRAQVVHVPRCDNTENFKFKLLPPG